MVMDGMNANKPNCHKSLQMDTLSQLGVAMGCSAHPQFIPGWP